MNICGVDYESYVDGKGIRTAIFISGCSKNCFGCHNKRAQSKSYGEPFTDEVFDTIVSEIKSRPYLSGITLTGGDPFESYNIDECSKLLHDLKTQLNGINIWVYTGETYEYIHDNFYYALCNIDVLVDGKFDIDQKDRRLAFRGSSNQRIIDVQKSLRNNKVEILI